eukprot:TRINITY_DN2199_c1_g2_i2.p1 TRINITY_DN2199_c1_g2~~TRINITY_DN2199_c1_g2_i2.p1  ORF type:complete len:238 (-),score=49.53 TRINITY_DN2199_c1_g2_i2:95-808(-)
MFSSLSVPVLLLLGLLLLFGALQAVGSEVYLEHAIIHTTHDASYWSPTIYFKCVGEKKVYLPSIQKIEIIYNFSQRESWQPIMLLEGTRCKKCGLYDEDDLSLDDVFDEWEICPHDFAKGTGIMIRDKFNEFVASFFCQRCVSQPGQNDYSAMDASPSLALKWSAIVVANVLGVGLLLGVVICALRSYRRAWPFRRGSGEDTMRLKEMFDERDELMMTEQGQEQELAEREPSSKYLP